MYSYENRKRAVELYIKCGHCAAGVIRELGCPNRGSHATGPGNSRRAATCTQARSVPALSPTSRYAPPWTTTSSTAGRWPEPCARCPPKSRTSLAAWVDELAPGQRREVRAGGNCTHSYEDKVDAVAPQETRGKSTAEIASERGAARETPYLWKRDPLVLMLTKKWSELSLLFEHRGH